MPVSTPTTDSATTPSAPTKSGITLTADGQRVIPSSQRPDGSTRREIRVRPGYRPPEDVEVYKNRTAAAWKNRGSGGVPGAATLSDEDRKQAGGSPVSNKNAKRKAARKKAKEKETGGPTGADGKTTEPDEKATESDGKTTEPQQNDQLPSTPATGHLESEQSPEEKDKLVKAIRKKIRQANELKNRKEVGESLLPEQLEKVIKLKELARQLDALGFDE